MEGLYGPSKEVRTKMNMNMQWIPVNLPWKSSEVLEFPEFPTDLVVQKVQDQFGHTFDELNDAFVSKFGKETFEVGMGFQTQIDPHYELSVDEFRAKMQESTDPAVVALWELNEKVHAIEEFTNDLPEVIGWFAENERIRGLQELMDSKNSFSKSSLNRQGVMIEVLCGGKLSRYILGDLNTLGGRCDDCRPFEDDSVITRALVLISEETLLRVKELD
jgi:hypothetical protein